MKKKTVEEKPHRGRRSNAELWVPSIEARRKIKDVADKSKMSVAQVYVDTLDFGLAEVERMYGGMIAMREEIQRRKTNEVEPPRENGAAGGVQPDTKILVTPTYSMEGLSEKYVYDISNATVRDAGPGSADPDFRHGQTSEEPVSSFRESAGGSEDGSDNADERSGFEPASEAGIRLAEGII